MAHEELSDETAKALLEAIKEAAHDADARGTEALRQLAEAYAAVVAAMSDSAATERRKGIS